MLDKFQCRNRFRCSKSALRRLALANLEPNRSELKYPKVRRPQIISVYAMFQCANYADYRKTRLPCRRRRSGCGRGRYVVASIWCSFFWVGLVFHKPLSQKQRGTFLSLQHTATIISSVDWGLPMPAVVMLPNKTALPSNDRAGHAEGTGLPLSPMAERNSPSPRPRCFPTGALFLARRVYGVDSPLSKLALSPPNSRSPT